MDRREREALDRYLTTEPEEPEHEDCGCSLRETDCCDQPRWTCETAAALDSNGDVDVVVCKRGFGCDDDSDARERMAAAEADAMEERMARYLDGEDD